MSVAASTAAKIGSSAHPGEGAPPQGRRGAAFVGADLVRKSHHGTERRERCLGPLVLDAGRDDALCQTGADAQRLRAPALRPRSGAAGGGSVPVGTSPGRSGRARRSGIRSSRSASSSMIDLLVGSASAWRTSRTAPRHAGDDVDDDVDDDEGARRGLGRWMRVPSAERRHGPSRISGGGPRDGASRRSARRHSLRSPGCGALGAPTRSRRRRARRRTPTGARRPGRPTGSCVP